MDLVSINMYQIIFQVLFILDCTWMSHYHQIVRTSFATCSFGFSIIKRYLGATKYPLFHKMAALESLLIFHVLIVLNYSTFRHIF